MKIGICSDHGGYDLKQVIKAYLDELGYEYTDTGCFDKTSCHYPDMAFPCAEALARGEFDRGIFICSTGVGVSLCANKVKGVRCALISDCVSAELTRRHNDTNALAMGGLIIGPSLAKEIVRIWLTTPYEGGRHAIRVGKINDYDNGRDD